MGEGRLAAARTRRHGLQYLSFEQAAARLAGGFSRPVDREILREVIQSVLSSTDIGELEGIKALPGMIGAAADTLHKAWHAGIDLSRRTAEHARLDAMARLEAAVLKRLPPGMMRPSDIVSTALKRIAHAPTVLGTLDIVGLTELEPCWRHLLEALARHIPVRWTAGPRSVPPWLEGTGVLVSRAGPESPHIVALSAATAYHEAVEAMRWVRDLLASGRAKPEEIAIATAAPGAYDDHFLALRTDAGIELHFVHGVRVVNSRPGQAAAAVADVLVRGLTQARFRRLATLCGASPALSSLPDGWLRVLPKDAPLSGVAAWQQVLARLKPQHWPDGADHSTPLRAAIELLAQGPQAALRAGTAFLTGLALSIWHQALVAGPADSIDATLESLRMDDGFEAGVSVAWMSASSLAAAPRRFVRLIGLNSSRWPRGIAEDRLIPDHVIPTAELDPLPVSLADRRDFGTILATTPVEVVLSRARRDTDGRLLGRSSLLAAYRDETYLHRHALAPHAFSETDRLMARPDEFGAQPQALSAHGCWRDWCSTEVTPHDGLCAPDHPLIHEILGGIQSASSLRRLLRNPLEFVWHYAFGWRAPEGSLEPLVLDPLATGDLVHQILENALRDIDIAGGLARAAIPAIEDAVARAARAVAAEWEGDRPVPPAVIWRWTLDDAQRLAIAALTHGDALLPGTRSYAEVPFGGAEPMPNVALPWDPSVAVTIPTTGFRIKGYIDRLDITADGHRAFVCDYKTGRVPEDDIQLHGGRELQRCLYAFAVRALLGSDVAIGATLLYPRQPISLMLKDPPTALSDVVNFLRAARTSLASGAGLPGIDAGGMFDDLAFALPANAAATYLLRKRLAAEARLGDVVRIWDAP
jgi:hypothetical protein